MSGGGRTDEKNGLGCCLAVDLLHELRLEGDQADEAVGGNQVEDDNHGEDAVFEQSLQGWNKI